MIMCKLHRVLCSTMKYNTICKHLHTIPQGGIYINGKPMKNFKDWYVANLGYILQSSEPYFDMLTVRENVTLAAQLKLSKKFNEREKFKKIEQVLKVVKGYTHTYSCTHTCGHPTNTCTIYSVHIHIHTQPNSSC